MDQMPFFLTPLSLLPQSSDPLQTDSGNTPSKSKFNHCDPVDLAVPPPSINRVAC